MNETEKPAQPVAREPVAAMRKYPCGCTATAGSAKEFWGVVAAGMLPMYCPEHGTPPLARVSPSAPPREPTPPTLPQCLAITSTSDDLSMLKLYFERPLTNDELRSLHQWLVDDAAPPAQEPRE